MMTKKAARKMYGSGSISIATNLESILAIPIKFCRRILGPALKQDEDYLSLHFHDLGIRPILRNLQAIDEPGRSLPRHSARCALIQAFSGGGVNL